MRHRSPHICAAGRRCSKPGRRYLRQHQEQWVCTRSDFSSISQLISGLQSHPVSPGHGIMLAGRSGMSSGAWFCPGWLIACSLLNIWRAAVWRHRSGCSQHPGFPRNQQVRLSAWHKHPDRGAGDELAAAGNHPPQRESGEWAEQPQPKYLTPGMEQRGRSGKIWAGG